MQPFKQFTMLTDQKIKKLLKIAGFKQDKRRIDSTYKNSDTIIIIHANSITVTTGEINSKGWVNGHGEETILPLRYYSLLGWLFENDFISVKQILVC